MAHAFFFTGNLEEGIATALRYVEQNLDIPARGNADVITLRYGLFSVEEARKLIELAYQSPLNGSQKVLIIATGRLFHEAQNAILKLFEEPPQGTTLILVIPSEGVLLPTLRSRMVSLRHDDAENMPESVRIVLKMSPEERSAWVEKLVERSKSDKSDAERQGARLEALTFAEGLLRCAYERRMKGDDGEEITGLLSDLDRFIPILNERSAPLKLIFEHLLLVLPDTLKKGI